MKKENENDSPRAAHPVVVIGRLFGSGGRHIGRMLAERLGFKYYDKELLSEAAESLGFSNEIFAACDERRPSPMRALLQGLYGIADNFHDTSLSGERLYDEQSQTIRRICDKGPSVIVGRTADYVMRNHPGLVSVFLHSPIGHRAQAIVDRGDASSIEEATELARRRDSDREDYYNYYTGRKWGSAANYHLSIDASSMPVDDVVEIIAKYVEYKLKPQ